MPKLRRKKHSPAGASHRAGYSLGAGGQALKRAVRLHKRAKALNDATRHDKDVLEHHVTKSTPSSPTTPLKRKKKKVVPPKYKRKHGGYLPYKRSDRIK